MKVNKLGVLEYYTESKGVGGRIKTVPEDFVVSEVTPKGKFCNVNYSLREKLGDTIFRFKTPKKYVRATLVKKDYTTMKCVSTLSKILGARIGSAGMKDKRALTAQRISIPSKNFKPVKRKDFFLKNFEYNHNRIALGNLKGNAFEITLRESGKGFQNFFNELREKNFFLPNFFGEQRFGKHSNTHLIGIHLLKKEYDKACKELLKSEGIFESRVRKNLSSGSLKALKKLGNRVLEFYVHAAQSYIFNSALSSLIIAGDFCKKLELPGLSVKPSEHVKKVMPELGLKLHDFGNDDLGLRIKGSDRKCFMRVNDFRLLNERPLRISFRLEKGCYASIVLKELCK